MRRFGAPRFGDPSGALVGRAVERGKDSDFKTLGKRQGWRDQNGGVGGIRSAASDSGCPSARMAWTKPYAKDGDFVFPSLKARGRVPLSASVFVADQPAPQPKQLASEQGESRTENRAGHSASRKDSDDARSVHAGGLR